MHASVRAWYLAVSLCGSSVYSLEIESVLPTDGGPFELEHVRLILDGKFLASRGGERMPFPAADTQTAPLGWEAGMGNGHALRADWLGTAPG